MKTAYVQCSPISVSYPNILHLRQAARLTGAKRFFLCIWDPVVFEDPAFFARSDGKRSRMERLQENARIHQRILEIEGIEVHTLYLSEAWSRLFSKPHIARIFNSILSNIKVSDLTLRKGLPGEDLTLSKINYTIADFLVAAMFHNIFVEMSATAPAIYVTSRRLAPFLPAISKVMEDPQSPHPMPDIAWIYPFPMIMDSKGMIPSMEMNQATMERVIEDGLLRHPLGRHEIHRLYSLLDIKAPSLLKKIHSGTQVSTAISKDLHQWFTHIRKGLAEPAPQGQKTISVTSPEQFHRSVRPLSEIKLRILSLCNGTKTSYHIAKELGLKQVTASVYLGRLRSLGLITEGRRPVRTVSRLVVDLDSMKAT